MTEWEALARIALAGFLGGAIGIEREIRGKEAGIRTLTLVATGAATFIVLALRVMSDSGIAGIENARLDPLRVIGETVGGIGFLGGAIIFRRADRAEGVTTAAAVWTATGIGLASGTGNFIIAVGGTCLIIGTLYGFRIIEAMFGLKGPVRIAKRPNEPDTDDVQKQDDNGENG